MVAGFHRVPELALAPNVDEVDQFVAEVTRLLVSGRESFSGVDLSTLQTRLGQLAPDFLRLQFDDYYTRHLLELIPKLVARTIRLSELAGVSQPTIRVEAYLREATRCYVFGFRQAAVTLSRAAVEHALRERVVERAGRSSHKLVDLIEGSRRIGLLDDARSQLATTVKLHGDQILHGGDVEDGEAWECLVAARGVLEYLHA